MSGNVHNIDGERAASVVTASKPKISRQHGMLMIGVAGLALAAYFAFHGNDDSSKKKDTSKPTQISQLSAFEPAKEAASPPPPPPQQIEAPRQTFLQQAIGQVGEDPLVKARAASLLGQGAQQQHDGMVDAARPPIATIGNSGRPESELASKLHATILEGSKATVLQHPEFTATMGTLIPCTLLTAMDSSAPGIVTCMTQRDVFGTTGSVVVMEKGTKIVGEYASRMEQGRNRMFVLWNRAETPHHVVITLGSPAADGLGRAGFAGEINNHFWQRFGGALMLTLIDGAFSTATSLASKNGSTSLNFDSGQSAASEALSNSINISPTLTKNQGEVVAVMVARDLDFSSVYALSTRSSP
jgi:type IV secretion system protein VirB10